MTIFKKALPKITAIFATLCSSIIIAFGTYLLIVALSVNPSSPLDAMWIPAVKMFIFLGSICILTFGLILAIVSIICLIRVFNKRKDPRKTIIILLVLSLFPTIGMIFATFDGKPSYIFLIPFTVGALLITCCILSLVFEDNEIEINGENESIAE